MGYVGWAGYLVGLEYLVVQIWNYCAGFVFVCVKRFGWIGYLVGRKI